MSYLKGYYMDTTGTIYSYGPGTEWKLILVPLLSRRAIGNPKIGVESFILIIEHILISILFNLTRATLLSLHNHVLYEIVMLMWLRNDNNVARVKLKRIDTSICSIINIKLST